MSANPEVNENKKTKIFNKKEWRRRKYSNKYKGKIHCCRFETMRDVT
jgi:hypothetical protein